VRTVVELCLENSQFNLIYFLGTPLVSSFLGFRAFQKKRGDASFLTLANEKESARGGGDTGSDTSSANKTNKASH
jgi:hypothetical protein